jgi:tRNA nucleotidyltransferase (CCA-adding enzyme)
MKDYASLGKEVLKNFNDHGYEAYFVGGFVRDFLLGIPLMDIDIATSATPDEVSALFPNTKNTGLKFGTVTVLYQHFAYEVTTFRTEGGYADSRHPEGVLYAKTLAEDLARRDFTVNALAMDKTGNITDLVGGLADLKNHTLRAIGDPDTRFQEDALRILRAFRFVAKLDFTIESATLSAIRRNMQLLSRISVERIMLELKTMMKYPSISMAFSAMSACGLGSTLPDLEKAIALLAQRPTTPLTIEQFYALSFYLNGGEIPDFWRFSNKEKTLISQLITLLTVTESDPYDPILVYAHGLDSCLLANEISRLLPRRPDQESAIRRIDHELPIHKTCDLRFKGQDLLTETFIKDARIIGEVIGDLLLMVITQQLPNEYDALRSFALLRVKTLEAQGGPHGT